MNDANDLRIKVYADGADLRSMISLARNDLIRGLTTNPTLMKQSGVTDYESFAKEVLNSITSKPISFEVFADEPDEMRRQAREIASWGSNVYVKVPVTTTDGKSCGPLIQDLARDGVKLNVTAIMTAEQVDYVSEHLSADVPAVVSVFAGRIADTGRDPIPIMSRSLSILSDLPKAELLWASPRELLNIIQAEEVGCQIITVTPDLIKKFELIGKDLSQFSLETVKMFYNDAAAAGYTIRSTTQGE